MVASAVAVAAGAWTVDAGRRTSSRHSGAATGRIDGWRSGAAGHVPAGGGVVDAAISLLLDADGGHGAGVGRLLRELALGGVDVLLPAEHVVVAELEDVGRDVRALAVALAQVHVHVDLGHRVLLSAMRSASSSGMASATCRVFAEVSGWSPGPERSTSHSSTVLRSRPMPSISTSTTSPGSIGRELAGVPLSTTSPGSRVISRHRSASW